MTLPYGISMTWAHPDPSARITRTFSYFSLTPFGYANWSPIITAMLFTIATILFIFSSIFNKRWGFVLVLTVVSVLMSFSTMYFISVISLNKVTALNVIISIMLIISAIFQHKKTKYK